MIVYYCSINEFDTLEGSELLPPVRRIRMQKYFQLDDQKRSLAAGLLLRGALGIDEAMCVEADPNGKLFLPGGPFFNLSHAGEFVAIVVSDCEVGIDVGDIGPYSEDVAQRCFTRTELAWMDNTSDPEQAFCVLWTGKESIMKATGLGFRLEPDSFTILPIDRSAHFVAGSAWYPVWRRIENHMICVSSARPQPMKMRRVSRAELICGTTRFGAEAEE